MLKIGRNSLFKSFPTYIARAGNVLNKAAARQRDYI